jgi:hypothetical protein
MPNRVRKNFITNRLHNGKREKTHDLSKVEVVDFAPTSYTDPSRLKDRE